MPSSCPVQAASSRAHNAALWSRVCGSKSIGRRGPHHMDSLCAEAITYRLLMWVGHHIMIIYVVPLFKACGFNIFEQYMIGNVFKMVLHKFVILYSTTLKITWVWNAKHAHICILTMLYLQRCVQCS